MEMRTFVMVNESSTEVESEPVATGKEKFVGNVPFLCPSPDNQIKAVPEFEETESFPFFPEAQGEGVGPVADFSGDVESRTEFVAAIADHQAAR